MVVDGAENIARSEEMHLGAAALARAGHFDRRHRHAVAELHLMDLAVAPDGEPQPLR